MLSLRSRSSTRSPVQEVPYDVLREIFLHCLPQHPLEIQQPNTTVAPMLLCQICSSWRTIALASPSLWSHLSFCITTLFVSLGSWAFLQKEIDFIQWWRRNQGSMAPFLRLEIKMDEDDYQAFSWPEDELAGLIEYVTSAQYLQVERWWDIAQEQDDEVEIEGEIEFPNLHTLATYWPGCDRSYFPYIIKVLVKPAFTCTPSLLRRLVVSSDEFLVTTIVPSQWSGLTHLSMSHIVILLDFWFCLVRTVTDLQWAYLFFDGIYDTHRYPEPAAKYTLPRLSTLFFNYNFQHGDHIDLPLTLLFSALYLPTLHTLSLSSATESWDDERAIDEVYTVLHSAPAITTLAIRGREFLYLHEDDYPAILAAIGDVEPIWDHSPHLTHLQIELPDVNYCTTDSAGEMLDTFVHSIFLSNRSWLGLDNAACPIKSMTLMAAKMLHGPCFEDIRDLTMASIQKRTVGVSNIVFKVISHLEDDTGAEAWKEWGSRSPS